MVPGINVKGWPFVICDGTPYHHTSCGRDMPLYSEGRIETFKGASTQLHDLHHCPTEAQFVPENDMDPFDCYPIPSALLQIKATVSECQWQYT